jgi:hypothetical protein
MILEANVGVGTFDDTARAYNADLPMGSVQVLRGGSGTPCSTRPWCA